MVPETMTHFGRHMEIFTELQKRIQKKETPLEGLVIGAGLSSDALFSLTCAVGGERAYSWEPLELLAVLRRAQEDSSIDVMDISQEVCHAVADQKVVPVHDFWGTRNEYIQNILSQFSYEGMDPEEINQALGKASVCNRVTCAAMVDMPEPKRVFSDDILLPRMRRQYDVVTLLAFSSAERNGNAVYKNVSALVKKEGFLLASSGNGLLSPEGFERYGLERVWFSPYVLMEECMEGYSALFQRSVESQVS